MKRLNVIHLSSFANQLMPKRWVFTQWDEQPFQMGQEYLGQARHLGGPFYQIGLNAGLVNDIDELRFTWLHELAHVARGHVGRTGPDGVSQEDWIEHRERVADMWAHEMMPDLESYAKRHKLTVEQMFFRA